MGVQVGHACVVELHGHAQMVDARVAGHGDCRTRQPRVRPDGKRHIGTGVGGADTGRCGSWEHAHTQVIGGRRSAGGGSGAVDEGVIGAGLLHRKKERLGQRVGDAAHAGVIDHQNLIARVAKQREAEPSIPLHVVALRVKIEAHKHRVTGVQAHAVPVLFGGHGGVTGAADPSAGGQRIGRGCRVVAFHLGSR